MKRLYHTSGLILLLPALVLIGVEASSSQEPPKDKEKSDRKTAEWKDVKSVNDGPARTVKGSKEIEDLKRRGAGFTYEKPATEKGPNPVVSVHLTGAKVTD